ncbi:hypothetical protein LTR91_018661 [Friedmanniomyces endolithicus]|uniref:Uncharacterized protein n=1 Tax=Friedmanniomyces endolithicus TaxID=329885 RepID=A0AAN6HEZ4_9PEZI|nr:hypothetical protein LTR94_015038 [Friedmanniomyces endolithicus]KAK0778063.1 hypothetical protein LTR59_013628 [Friedmanniomyces endolithicus]KAK0819860.1 hypothetical protein LTR75_001888 [Friedmanniomyces endolithicus]KAK0870839.1 hypothetical protein LTR87_013154 [Friedmanniomyces endolithicus]KAK0895275.1 hypothetical protein LTR02_011866 [Friedmanniomyces endolithicus]
MITPEEYAALPPSIQRKYFSPVERLRIGQEAATRKRRKHRRKQTWLSSTSSTDSSTRPQSAHESRRSPTSSDDRQQAEAHSTRHQIGQSNQSKWNLRLPGKARCQHSSNKEQTVLVEESRDAQVDSKSTESRTGPPSTRPPLPHGHSAPEVRHIVSAGAPDASRRTTCPEEDVRPQTSCGTAETEMGIFKLYFRKTGRTSPPASDTAPVSREPPPPRRLPQPTAAAKLKRKSIHRALALTPLVLPPPTLTPLPPMLSSSPSPPPSPSPSSSPTPSPTRAAVLSARLSRPYTDPMLLPPEALSEPTYFHDSEPRRQLREYPGSQHRFDEAIEFGSPSPEPQEGNEFIPIQSTVAFDSTDEEEASLEIDEPSTPTGNPSHHQRKVAQSASFDSGIVLPLQTGERSRSSSNISGRETTLRLTRPRPELRTSEDKLYSWQRTQTSGVAVANSDPLALEPLCISEDSTGAHGAFAGRQQQYARPKGLGRVWKSFRGQ